jgi:ADP-ribose pyrophosphatase
MGQLPDQARRVFEGVMFDVYQWEQEMFDGTTETFEMLKRQDTVEVLLTKNGKILLQEQEQPDRPSFLSLPGGRVEQGEGPLDGAKREVLEETGYESEDWEFLYQTNSTPKLAWTIFVYVARDGEWKQEMELDAGEKIKLQWVTLDELLALVDRGELSCLEQDLRVQLVRALCDEPCRKNLEKLLFGG